MTSSDFYSLITKWQTGTDFINNKNCFAVNFGYNGEIPMPTISLPIKINQEDLKHYYFEKSYTCYFIFVGGKFVDDMKEIVDTVEDITEQFHGMMPMAMFVMGKISSFEKDNYSQNGNQVTKVSSLKKVISSF